MTQKTKKNVYCVANGVIKMILMKLHSSGLKMPEWKLFKAICNTTKRKLLALPNPWNWNSDLKKCPFSEKIKKQKRKKL